MIKVPRYMKEFANAQRKRYVNNDLMQKKYKNAAMEAIDYILWNTECELITINEGMKMLCNPLDGICQKGEIGNVG